VASEKKAPTSIWTWIIRKTPIVARMQRSGIREIRRFDYPGFRCTLSGLRWLGLLGIPGPAHAAQYGSALLRLTALGFGEP